MKKSIVSVMMAMLLAVLLAGCTGGDSEGKTDAGAEAAKPAATAETTTASTTQPAEKTPAPAVQAGKYYNLEAKDIASYVEQGALILDVRTAPELEGPLGKIEGAINIPLDQLPNRIGELDKSRGYIVVCRSGNRSSSASQYLVDMGFTYIYNLKGGMKAYRALHN